MATTRLTRTQTAGTRTKGTLSTWVKRGDLSEDTLYTQFADGSNFTRFRFTSNTINCNDRTGGSENWYFTTNAVYRDPSAWYHVVISIDTTQATDTNRLRCWVNGVLQTFTSQSYPTQDANMNMNQTGQTSQIGANELTADYFDGVMAHTHWTDGYSYAATDFGETDSTSGIWVPKTGPSVTYGTNGFFLKYASGAHGTDSSGESNDFVVSGTMTNTQDTPSNNFATMNPLNNFWQGSTFSNGNNTIVTSSSAGVYSPNFSSVGLESGKWYWEVKFVSGGGGDASIGVASTQITSIGTELGNYVNDYSYYAADGNIRNDDSGSSYGNSYSAGDIIGVALDLTNMNLYFSKNGTWQDSGDPTSGATGTGAVDITLSAYNISGGERPLGAWFPAVGFHASSTGTHQVNFGNGYFGTTAISSGNADDAGEGDFEYDVPAGYYAICTNNLGDQS